MLKNSRIPRVFGIIVVVLILLRLVVGPAPTAQEMSEEDQASKLVFLGMAIPSPKQLYFYLQRNLLTEFILMQVEDLFTPSEFDNVPIPSSNQSIPAGSISVPSGSPSIPSGNAPSPADFSAAFDDDSDSPLADGILGSLPSAQDLSFLDIGSSRLPEEYEPTPEETLWGFNEDIFEAGPDPEYSFDYERDSYLMVDPPSN